MTKLIRLSSLLFTVFAFLWSASLFGAEGSVKYAVETVDGAPRITIDGVPTRARFFFGLNGSEALIATPKWQTVERTLTAEADSNGGGTVHFRFGPDPGVIAIDNFSIVDEETDKPIAGPYSFESASEFTDHWTVWRDEYEGVRFAAVKVQPNAGVDGSGGLLVRIYDSKQASRPDFHFYLKPALDLRKGKKYRVRFDLLADKNRNIHVHFYKPAEPAYVSLGAPGSNVFEAQVKLAAAAGVNFISFAPYAYFWPDENGNYDWDALDSMCDAALRANPNALLVPRLKFDASPAWLKKHPNAKAVWEGAGEDYEGLGWNWAAPASPEYRKAACEAFAAVIRHLESKYGDSIAGYHPVGQNTDEWFIPNTWTEGYPGYSVSDRDAFRAWLREKYKTNDALRKAWGRSDVSLDTAVVPSKEERDESRKEPLVKSQALLDFNAYFQSSMTGLLLDLARTARKETNGRKLIIFFYGYSYEFSTVQKGPAASAHYALKDLLASPDVDIICSPISYVDRQLGGGCSCMLNAESVSLAGKMYLYEDDSRTFIAHASNAPISRYSATPTLEGSVNVLLRNSGETAMRNFGTWLMDLGAIGWYNSKELWDASASLEKMDRYFLDHPTKYEPEIGLFLSDKSMLKISSGKYSSNVNDIRRDFNLLSAPYAQYELDDLLSGAVAAPKLTVVVNANAVDGETRAAIEKRAKETNARVLYVDNNDITTHELRGEATKAGVWIYTDLWCNVWANGPFVLLHAPADGDYTFRAPGGKKIYDYFTDELVSEDGTAKFPMKLGDTKIFRLE